MGVIARRILRRHNSSGRLGIRLLEAEIPESSGPKVVSGRPDSVVEEAEVSVRGVIRSGDIPLLTHYGTAYGLYDYPTAGYDCALKSAVYRLADWVGEYVEVTGTLAEVGKELPVMDVARLRLLKTKWMR